MFSTNFRTKIFIRHVETLFAIEDAFQLRKHELASKIKAKWLGVRQRRAFLHMRDMVIFVQKFARRWLAKRRYVKRKWAAGVIKVYRPIIYDTRQHA